MSSSGRGSFYHVVEEVDGPVEGLADAGNVLEPLGAAVVLADLVDGEAGGGDGEARQHAQAHQDVEDPLDAAGRKWDRSGVGRNNKKSRKRISRELKPALLPICSFTLGVGTWRRKKKWPKIIRQVESHKMKQCYFSFVRF